MRASCFRSSPRAATLLMLPLLVILSGCDDPAYERGMPPPISLDQVKVEVPLFRYGVARLLRRAVGVLASDGHVQRLDAFIRTTSLPQRDATRAVLIQMGLDPARIQWSAQSGDVVVLTQTTAATVSCGAALRSDWQGDVGNSVTSLGTCIQANNLAEMVSDPRDLAKPVTLGPTNGAVAARAIRDWENGTDRQPLHRDSGEVGGGGDANAGGGSGTSVGGLNGSIPAGSAAATIGAQSGNVSTSTTTGTATGATLNPLLTPPPDLSDN